MNIGLNEQDPAQDFEFVSGVGVTHADPEHHEHPGRSTSRWASGNSELNLRGKPLKDYSVSIKGGVGEARGFIAERYRSDRDQPPAGFGGVDVTGMSQNGNQYVNEAYQKSPVTIRLTIEGGVGGIKLLCE